MSWQLDFGEYFYRKPAEEARNRIFTINYSYSICSNRIGFGNLMEAVSCWLNCLRDHCWNINSSLVGCPVPSSCPEKQISHRQKATERMGWGVHRCVDTRTKLTSAEVQIWKFNMCSDYFNLNTCSVSAQIHACTHTHACTRKPTSVNTWRHTQMGWSCGRLMSYSWCQVASELCWVLELVRDFSSLSVWLPTAALDGNTDKNIGPRLWKMQQMHERSEGKIYRDVR